MPFKYAMTLWIATAPGLALGSQVVWIVDQQLGPGADFATLAEAINAANHDDVILVRSGDYEDVDLTGVGLALVADEGANVKSNSLTVTGLTTEQSALVSGMTILTVTIASNDGHVWLDDVFSTTLSLSQLAHGVRLQSNSSVLFSDCHFDSADTPAIVLEQSSLHLFSSEAWGGQGQQGGCVHNPGFPPFVPPYNEPQVGELGEPGILLTDNSFIYLNDAGALGGQGGNGTACGSGGGGFPPPCSDGGTGGYGIVVEPDSTALKLDSNIFGGSGGLPGGFFPSPCEQGPFGTDSLGQINSLPGRSGRLTMPRVVRETQPFTVEITGPAGSSVFVLFDYAQDHHFELHLSGTMVLPTTASVVHLGTLSGSTETGSIEFTTAMPDELSGSTAERIYAQPVFLNTDGTTTLGTPHALIVVDQSVPF